KAGEQSAESLATSLATGATAIIGATVAVAAVGAGVMFEFAEHSEKFSSAIRQAGVASHATAEQMRELEELALTKSMDSLRGSAITTAEALKQLALEGMDAKQ